MCQYVEQFDKLHLQNNHLTELAGPVFEHSIPDAIQALMTLQEFNHSSMTSYYHVAEKAYNILEKQGNLKSMFPGITTTSKNDPGRQNNGSSHYNSMGYALSPPTHAEKTTSEGGDAMDLSTAYSGVRCFKCGHFGHIAKFCPRTSGLSSEAAGKATQADRYGGRRGGGHKRGKSKGKANATTVSEGAGSSVVNNKSYSLYEQVEMVAFKAEDNSMVFLPVEVGSGKFEALVDTGAN